MSIIGWIVLGLIAGFIGSKIVNKTGEGFSTCRRLHLHRSRATGVTGFNPYSMFVAIVGAIVVLTLYHASAARAPPAATPSPRPTMAVRREIIR